jgi:RNA polymerase sigma-70 factor (ECF subfamily)
MREISKSAATDLELVEAIKSEEGKKREAAFNALFKKYNDSMVFHFRGLVKNDEEVARELVLEAFMKVNTNIEKFNKETAVFSTWLFKLTQNLFIDRLRKKKEETISLSDMATYDEESHTIEFDIASEDGTPETEEKIKEDTKEVKMRLSEYDRESDDTNIQFQDYNRIWDCGYDIYEWNKP